MASIKPRVLVLGHSFIRRLFEAVDSGKFAENFGLKQCQISGRGYGGGTVRGVRSSCRHYLEQFQPHIVILQIRGNDLCDSKLSADSLAYDIYNFALEMSNNFGALVYVCEIFPRLRPRGMAPHLYEVRRKNVNKGLTVLLLAQERVSIWPHKRIFNSPLQHSYMMLVT
ncbi:hypothetical protein KP79_PYT00653 [Mizuhopecten yessoensis]|uniref:SGNH hydrolase-type esterase domain-containing protein n=1 Tax=Mizuhopecten yessoensis TaxID=6573 RepID=A0A210QTK6_MIZYE|nr:hypothetical protein KP79_PYT00653 [Mizuhopecten yessoensis]